MSRVWFLSLVCLTATVPAAVSQPPAATAARFVGESGQTLKRLAEAEQKLLSGAAAEAADELQRLLDEAGDDLVTVDGQVYQPARRVAHRLLATLPPETLRVYRARIDPPARTLLERGKSNRDPQPLRLLLHRYFASRPAGEALLLLGDLLFERGQFREAETYWRQLLPVEPKSGPDYPDAGTDPASIRARIILSEIFRRETDTARQSLVEFTKEFPESSGRLAGKTGRYRDILQAILDRPPGILDPSSASGDWPTLAGNAGRDGRVHGPFPYYWPRSPSWKMPLPSDRLRQVPALVAAKGNGTASRSHPIVADGIVYVPTAYQVAAFDLRTGERRGQFDIRLQPGAPERSDSEEEIDSSHDSNSLIAAGGWLYGCLGGSRDQPAGDAGELAAATNYLVSLRPASDAKNPLAVRWMLAPPIPGASWEGMPIVDSGRIFAAFRQTTGNRVRYSIACYADPPGKPFWSTEVCDAPLGGPTMRRTHLLTLADGRLIFAPDVGLAIAIDAETGTPVWGFRYPRNERLLAAGSPRDLCPPLHANGRVFLAPADSDRLHALDLFSGRSLWEAGPFQVSQLLGISRSRLIVTLTGTPSGPFPGVSGIRAFDVSTGSDRAPNGWAIHDDPYLRSAGRGLVSDDLILWPTNSRDGTFLLNATDGTRRFPWLPGASGHLAYADGVLLVATPTELWGYVATRRPETTPGTIPQPVSRRERAEQLADRAEIAARRGRTDETKEILQESLTAEIPDAWKVRAAARLRTLGATIPANVDRGGWLLDATGTPVRLGEFANESRPVGPAFPVPASTPDSAWLRRHRLGPDLTVNRVTMLANPACIPLLPFAGGADLPALGSAVDERHRSLIAADHRSLSAYRPGEDQAIWTTPLSEDVRLTHAFAVGDTLVAAGPDVVIRFRLTDGHEVWRIRIPTTDPLPGTEPQPAPRSRDTPTYPWLSDFRISGSYLLARIGDHHLAAIDLDAGQVRWVLDPHQRLRYSPFLAAAAPRFSPWIQIAKPFAIVQCGNRRWTIELGTGQVVQDVPTTQLPWTSPPQQIGPDRLLVADTAGSIRAIVPGQSPSLWSAEAGGESSLTGQPPAIRVLDGTVLWAVFRNYGVDLHLLDPNTGRSKWRTGPVFLPVGKLDLAGAAADESNLYIPAEGQLFTFRIDSGRLVSTTDLASAIAGDMEVAWQIHVGRRTVLAIPRFPFPFEQPMLVARRVIERWCRVSMMARLPAILTSIYDAWVRRTLPVLVLDPEMGQIRHRLDLDCGPVVGIHLGPEASGIATSGKVYWLK